MKRFLGFLAFALCTTAAAQTTSSGPYYATPSWDQKVQCDTAATCPRFVVLSNWGSAAVLDRETGLVWARSPLSGTASWQSALHGCFRVQVASGIETSSLILATGRAGWRLPSVQEFLTLLEGNSVSGLPAGHPFTDVSDGNTFWTSTRVIDDSTRAYTVTVSAGLINVSSDPTTAMFRLWCVRGGPGPDAQ
jgi:hypothetical protein